jgi:hypothetical protein
MKVFIVMAGPTSRPVAVFRPLQMHNVEGRKAFAKTESKLSWPILFQPVAETGLQVRHHFVDTAFHRIQ